MYVVVVIGCTLHALWQALACVRNHASLLALESEPRAVASDADLSCTSERLGRVHRRTISIAVLTYTRDPTPNECTQHTRNPRDEQRKIESGGRTGRR